MAEIVNLRQRRKRKARAEKEQAASENRARFGVAAPERRHREALEEQERQKLDGHRRDRDAEDQD